MSRILRVEAVVDRTGLSRRTLYNEISAGRFPRPIQLTPRSVGWTDDDVEGWIQRRREARDRDAA